MTESIDKNLDWENGDGPVYLNPSDLSIARFFIIRWNEWLCCICAASSLQEFHCVALEHAQFIQFFWQLLGDKF